MKQIIYTSEAPDPIGPYSQATTITMAGSIVLYTSGQIAIDPSSGKLLTDNITVETKLVMQHLGDILKKANMNWQHVLKCSIFLKNMDDFTQVNEIYGSYFDEQAAPARETVQVAKLPKDVNVEISLIASNTI